MVDQEKNVVHGHQSVPIGIALDNAGNAYVTGLTGSTSFPTVMPFQPASGGTLGSDAFVAKISFVPRGDANGDLSLIHI